MQGSVSRSGGLATPYLEVWRGLDCVKPHLTADAARPSRALSLVRLGRASANHGPAGPEGGDGASASFPAGFFAAGETGQRTNGQIFQFHLS